MSRLVALGVSVAVVAGCGYRPVASVALPSAGRLYIAPPRATRVDEPRFAIAYVTALSRALARRGLALAPTASAAWRLDTRVLALRSGDPSVAQRRVARRDLAIELSVRLWCARDAGASAWRSPLLRARQPWALAADAAESERSRRQSVLRLAERAAQQVAQLLAEHLRRQQQR
ncbi:MAG: hypothetical protein KC503_15820 [Myxococcales bacterium]|nr:hypothetical protein [Myxococcales bacterium]